MPPLRLPVGNEPHATQRQNARGKHGRMGAFGQNQTSVVVAHQAQSPGAGARDPLDRLFVGFGMGSGSTDAREGHP